MRWLDLAFLHWRVEPAALRDRLPRGLELDLHDGSAWLGLVPFRMSGIRPRFLPGLPGARAFPELNLRTYVTTGGKPGVWFFGLDVPNPLAVRVARSRFHLPYFRSRMSVREEDGWIHYRSERTHPDAPPASFAGRYRPRGEAAPARPGSLEWFLTERYCLYSADARGRLFRGDVQHAPWPLQAAELELEHNGATQQIGLAPPTTPPLAHFARRLDVVAWTLERA
jgi:uncharacterized protein YqjF (DUF2071 family)